MLRIDQITPVAADKGSSKLLCHGRKGVFSCLDAAIDCIYKNSMRSGFDIADIPRLQTVVDPLRVCNVQYILQITGQKHLSELFQHGFFLIGLCDKVVAVKLCQCSGQFF